MQPAWEVVEFKEGRFSVSLPEGYTQKKQKVTVRARRWR